MKARKKFTHLPKLLHYISLFCPSPTTVPLKEGKYDVSLPAKWVSSARVLELTFVVVVGQLQKCPHLLEFRNQE
jgi:hypothetical protein